MVGGADPLVACVVSAWSTPKACWINEVLIALLPPPQPPLWDDSNAALDVAAASAAAVDYGSAIAGPPQL